LPSNPLAGCGTANYNLAQDSDKLPLPIAQASWFGGGGPYIAEWLFGNSSIGAPSVGQAQYADPTGTYGVGASATYAITPALSVGGGAAYVLATDAEGPYGDSLFEFDAGATYRFNPNLVFNLFAGFLIPDSGDEAWAVAFRTQYSF
jgi:predicted porin